MRYLHIKNLMEHHPKYQDRDLKWIKVFTSMLDLDPEYAGIYELDKWRMVAFIILEMELGKEIPLEEEFLSRKGFDFTLRPLSDTLKSLEKFVEYRTEQSALGVVKIKKREKAPDDSENEKEVIDVFNHWNKQKIVIHRDKVKYFSTINSKLRIYGGEELKNAISNYAYVLHSKNHFWTYRWTIDQFFNRKNALDKFLDINFKASDYTNAKENSQLKEFEEFEN